MQLPKADRPDSRSSMGRFIVDLMRHDGKKVRERDVLKKAKNLIRKEADETKEVTMIQTHVIHQDSVLITHDFDAGQSTLTMNHKLGRASQVKVRRLYELLAKSEFKLSDFAASLDAAAGKGKSKGKKGAAGESADADGPGTDKDGADG